IFRNCFLATLNFDVLARRPRMSTLKIQPERASLRPGEPVGPSPSLNLRRVGKLPSTIRGSSRGCRRSRILFDGSGAAGASNLRGCVSRPAQSRSDYESDPFLVEPLLAVLSLRLCGIGFRPTA